MTLYKNVNGIDVELTADEIKAFHQREADFQSQALLRAITQFTSELDHYLNTKASERQYSSALSCVSYQDSTNSQWQQEAQTFLLWRDLILSAAYAYQTDVQNGQIANASFDAFLLTAPALIWP